MCIFIELGMMTLMLMLLSCIWGMTAVQGTSVLTLNAVEVKGTAALPIAIAAGATMMLFSLFNDDHDVMHDYTFSFFFYSANINTFKRSMQPHALALTV